MSTTEDTSAIDEKKAEESGTSTTSPDFKGFLFNYLSSIIFTPLIIKTRSTINCSVISI